MEATDALVATAPASVLTAATASKDKETVKVVVRCRPLFGKELVEGRQSIVTLDAAAALISLRSPETGQLKSFTFDSVYDESTSQRQFYDEAGYPLVESIFDGYNGTIFAYGQTGCGKTHTMQGKDSPPELRGVIPLSFDHIFDTIKADASREYMVRASYLEIYNEDIRDLLNDDAKKKLDLKESSDGVVYVKDLTEVVVRDVESMNSVMMRGFKNRTVGATLMNEGSSRSHSIFTVVVETSEKIAGQDHFKAGKLNLVDLAGSERQSKTGATGNRLKEGCKINLSLSALGNVISALVDGKGKHIPYRDSKLTRLLQDSLGGNTKTLMVAAVSPADYNYDETLSTLRYANRAKNIKNKPVVNEDPKDAKLREYKDEIERLRKLLESQSQSRGSVEGSASGMATPTRPLSPRPAGSSGGGRRFSRDSTSDEDADRLAKERQEIARYQQEAAEMLERAKRMMAEATALQQQQAQREPQQSEAASDSVSLSHPSQTEVESEQEAGDDSVPSSQTVRRGSGVLGNLPPLQGLTGKHDQLLTPELPGINSSLTPRDTTTKEQDAAIKRAIQEAAQVDAQARAMMAQAEAMMAEASQRVVVKEVIPDHHAREHEQLREMNQTILDQRNRIGQELEQTQVAMEAYLREKELLHAKLKKIESHILGGAGPTASSRTGEADSEMALLRQQVEYRRAQIKLREKAKKQAKHEAARRALELEKQQVEEELKTAQEAAQANLAAARKKEAKHRAKLEATRQEIADLNSEFERERENLLDTIREQTKEAKLLEQLVELFLPQNELVKVWERAVWSDEREEWHLPKLKPRSDFQKIKLPSLPLGGVVSSGTVESGGAEVVSDDDNRQGSAGRSTVRSSGSSSSKHRKSGAATRPSSNAHGGGAIVPFTLKLGGSQYHTGEDGLSSASARLLSPEAVTRLPSAASRGVSPHNSSQSKERRKHRAKTPSHNSGSGGSDLQSSPQEQQYRQKQEDQQHQHLLASAYDAPGASQYFPVEEDLLAPLASDYQPRDRLQSRQGSRQDSRQEKTGRAGSSSHGTPSGLGQLDHSPPVAVDKTRSSSRGERHSSHRHRHRTKDRATVEEGRALGVDDEWLAAVEASQTAPPGSGGASTPTHGSRKKSSKHGKRKKDKRDKHEAATATNEDDELPAGEQYASLRQPPSKGLDELL